MSATPIEWTDFSINPFRARDKATGRCGHFCVKISGGCKFCYSSRMQSRFGTHEFAVLNRKKVDLFLDGSKLSEVNSRKKPTKYFWCDMTDMFLEDYPDAWIDQCIGVMAWTKRHTHQVLTKRADRLMSYSQTLAALSRQQRGVRMARSKGFFVPDNTPGGMDWPLPNIWLGVSVEDRENKKRIDLLRQTPAAVRFLSLEPLLEDLGQLDLTGIHWVIAGGESGPGARPAPPEWFRSIRDQCRAAGVPFFFKQHGQWAPVGDAGKHRYLDVPVGDGTHHRMFSVGKKAAGALLDGKEYREFPK